MNRDCRKPVGVELESHSWDNACLQVEQDIVRQLIQLTRVFDPHDPLHETR